MFRFIDRCGVAKVNKVVRKFQSMIEDLDDGIQLCSQKQKTNSGKIAQMENENKILVQKAEEAREFKDNFLGMLNQKNNGKK